MKFLTHSANEENKANFCFFKTPESMDFDNTQPFEQIQAERNGAEDPNEVAAEMAVANAENAESGANLSAELAESRLSVLTNQDGDGVQEGVEAVASRQRSSNPERSTVTAALEGMDPQQTEEMQEAMEGIEAQANAGEAVADAELTEKQMATNAEIDDVLAETVVAQAETAQGFSEQAGEASQQMS